MGNALPEVKAAADRIAPTHDEDGLVQVVDWLLRDFSTPDGRGAAGEPKPGFQGVRSTVPAFPPAEPGKSPPTSPASLTLAEFQELIRRMYLAQGRGAGR